MRHDLNNEWWKEKSPYRGALKINKWGVIA
jgi:hypothetical protein